MLSRTSFVSLATPNPVVHYSYFQFTLSYIAAVAVSDFCHKKALERKLLIHLSLEGGVTAFLFISLSPGLGIYMLGYRIEQTHRLLHNEGRKRKRTSKFTICLAAMGKSAAVLSRRGHGCNISENRCVNPVLE